MKSVPGTVYFSLAAVVFIVSVSLACRIPMKTAYDQASTCPPATANSNTGVRMVFYNVENLFDTVDDSTTADEDFMPNGSMHWTYNRYKAKLEKICKVIVAIGEWTPPDIVGLAEIENSRVLHDLVINTPLLKYGYQYVHKNSPDIRGIDVAMLYNPATIEILETSFIKGNPDALSEKPTRDIICCKVLVRQREVLYLYINHWPSRSGGIPETEPLRLRSAGILRMKIDSVLLTGQHSKILIMGDFNDGPHDKSLTGVLQARVSADTIMPGMLYNLSAGYEQKNRTGSHKYQGAWNMLDQVIVSGALLQEGNGLRTTPVCFSVFDAPFLLTEDNKYAGMEPLRTYKGPVYVGGFSDHLPVLVDLY